MAISGASGAFETTSFGPLRLTAAARSLVKDNEPVAVGSRSLDILIVLIERAGEVVSTRDLLKRVWPDSRARPLRPRSTSSRASMIDHSSSVKNYA